jgi:hypothetical protein
VRSTAGDDAARARATETFIQLGIRSEERGKDAAGVAVVRTDAPAGTYTAPTREAAAASAHTIDNVAIVKHAGRFADLPIKALSGLMDKGQVLIGHTRWATQGAADQLVNASPLLAGALVGTHNGDVSPASIPRAAQNVKRAHGETDTELLYLALNRARRDRRALVGALRTIAGRAALAFVDRARPDRLYLARTALSPLSIAWTGDGDLVWASNPDWFRQIERSSFGRITFRNITLVPEGHLLTVDTATRKVVDTRRFTPTARARDLHLIGTAVYRNFTRQDRAADLELSRHRLVTAPLGPWKGLTPAPEILATPPVGTPLWDEFAAPPAGAVIDLDQLEALCWANGQFDDAAYAEVADASSEEEALEAFDVLIDAVIEDYNAGRTAPGFVMDTATGRVLDHAPSAA